MSAEANRSCVHWTGDRCRLNLYGGRPSAGTCRQCPVRLGVMDSPVPVRSDMTPAAKPKRRGCCGCGSLRLAWGVVQWEAPARWRDWQIAATIGDRAVRRRSTIPA